MNCGECGSFSVRVCYRVREKQSVTDLEMKHGLKYQITVKSTRSKFLKQLNTDKHDTQKQRNISFSYTIQTKHSHFLSWFVFVVVVVSYLSKEIVFSF